MKWLGYVLAMLAAGFASAQSPGATPLLAPLNPAFVQAQALRARQLQSAVPLPEPTVAGKGYFPSPVDRSHMAGLAPSVITGAIKLATAGLNAAYPSSFDLRSSGYVTPVRDQAQCGDCWSFSTIASVESNTLLGNGGTTDLSENHQNVRHGFDMPPCYGGNGDVAGAYMTRWGNGDGFAAGLVNESDDPYTSTLATSVAGLSPRVHLQEFLILPDRVIGTGLNATDNANYKFAIQNYGAVDIAIYADSGMSSNISSASWSQANKAYYYNGFSAPNHEVALVGWDDNYAASNFSTRPAGNGAFIVKNQWGTGWGSSGYFYVSYYDRSLSDAHVFRKPENTTNYARAYLYDPFGHTGSLGYGVNTAWGANVFTAVASETLQAVAINTVTVNSSYEIYIYTGVLGAPSSGVLEGGMVNSTGAIPYAGYHTITLSRPVSLLAGQKFAVVVKFTTPGDNHPLPIEFLTVGYNSAASASAGQSFVSTNGAGWTDLTTSFASANVNIRAYTAASPAFSIIDHYYQSILNRVADPGGKAFWQSEVARMSGLGVSATEAYIAMARYFFTSPEFLARGLNDDQFVQNLYLTFFNRGADQGGLDYWKGVLASGLPRDMVMYAFMFSPEFSSFMLQNVGYSYQRAEIGVVVDFYRGAFGRLPDDAGLKYWVNQFRSAQCSGNPAASVYSTAISIATGFFGSPEYWAVPPTPSKYVSDLYNAFMRRSADLAGFNYWVNQLASHAQSYDQVRRSFIDSPEFAARVQAIAGQACTGLMQ